MATNYATAVRNGSMAAARLHLQLSTKEKMEAHGGSIDVFGASLAISLPLLLRPLKGLLGAFLPEPVPGVLVTTERPLSIQRITAAHELGHFRLDHLPSLDDESILRRMAMPNAAGMFGHNMQEVEADAFAVAFLMPRWLIEWHCRRQGWLARDLLAPLNVYQLSLRLGTSYEATTWTLQRLTSAGNAQKTLLLTAQYRNHYYVEKLLGNLIGLGRLMAFVGAETGTKVGALTVISTHAEIDSLKASRQDITKLIDACAPPAAPAETAA
jgi:hypothetical protein